MHFGSTSFWMKSDKGSIRISEQSFMMRKSTNPAAKFIEIVSAVLQVCTSGKFGQSGLNYLIWYHFHKKTFFLEFYPK